MCEGLSFWDDRGIAGGGESWMKQCNEKQKGVVWQCNVEKARIKLHSLYPNIKIDKAIEHYWKLARKYANKTLAHHFLVAGKSPLLTGIEIVVECQTLFSSRGLTASNLLLGNACRISFLAIFDI